MSDILEATRILLDSANRSRRWREAVDASKGLPISPERARQLLDALGSREAVVAHVEQALANSTEP